MATQGTLVTASNFNDIQLEISRLLGDTYPQYPNFANAAKYGYGQFVTSTRVQTTVDEVAAIQIAKLKSDMIKIATHCGLQSDPTVIALPSVSAGNIIYASHLTAYQNCLDVLNTNRFLLGAGQYSDELLGTDLTNSRTIPWGNNLSYKNIYGGESIKHEFTLDFRSASAARYFFNAGGSVRLSASRTGGKNSVQNTNWTNTLNAMGTVIFNYSSCQGSAGAGSSIGFYQLTNQPQKVFDISGSVANAAYAANHYMVYVSCDIPNNVNGGARYIYVSIRFDDAHAQNSPHAYYSDWVDGTLTSNVSIRRATGINVTVDAPSGTNTRLLSQN